MFCDQQFTPPTAASICKPRANVLHLAPEINRGWDPDPAFHPSLHFQRKRRTETGESMSGSYKCTVVSKHSETCSSFAAPQQPHQKSRWVSVLPWPSTAFGVVPDGTNIIGTETLGFSVLQDISVSGLSIKDLTPCERPSFPEPVDRSRGFRELQWLQKRVMEMKSTLLSSYCGKEVYLLIPTALQPLGQQTCIDLCQRGTKVQSSAGSPFQPRRFMTSAWSLPFLELTQQILCQLNILSKVPAVFIQSSHWFILVKYLFQFEASSLWVPISPLQSFRMKNPLDSWVNDTDKELWLACVTAERPGAENSEVKTFVCYIFVGTALAWTCCLCFPTAWSKYQPGYAEKNPQHFLIVAGTAAGKSGSFTSEGSAWAARPLGYFKWKTYLCCLPKGKNELTRLKTRALSWGPEGSSVRDWFPCTDISRYFSGF